MALAADSRTYAQTAQSVRLEKGRARRITPDGQADIVSKRRATQLTSQRAATETGLAGFATDLVRSARLARGHDARAARRGAVLHVDVREAGLGQPGMMLPLRVGLALVVDAEEGEIQSHGR